MVVAREIETIIQLKVGGGIETVFGQTVQLVGNRNGVIRDAERIHHSLKTETQEAFCDARSKAGAEHHYNG